MWHGASLLFVVVLCYMSSGVIAALPVFAPSMPDLCDAVCCDQALSPPSDLLSEPPWCYFNSLSWTCPWGRWSDCSFSPRMGWLDSLYRSGSNALSYSLCSQSASNDCTDRRCAVDTSKPLWRYHPNAIVSGLAFPISSGELWRGVAYAEYVSVIGRIVVDVLRITTQLFSSLKTPEQLW